MHRIFLLLAVFVLLAGHVAGAQVDDVPDCDLGAAITDARVALDEAEAAEDADAALAILTRLRAELGALDAGCRGLIFTGEGDQIIGPLAIPDGVYIATFTTEEAGIGGVTKTTLDGRCDSWSLITWSGETEDITVLELEGCRLIIEVGINNHPWTLVLELLE